MAFPHEVAHGHLYGKLCRLLVDLPDAQRFTGHHAATGPVMESHPYRAGQTVKVVMVSRFGDCGITDRLDAEHGYDARVYPQNLEIIQ